MPTVKARKHRTKPQDTQATTELAIKEVPNSFYSKMKHLLDKYESGLSDVSSNTRKYLEGFGDNNNGL